MTDLRLPVAILLILLSIPGCRNDTEARSTEFKTVVLGFDGVDPDLVEKWLSELPHIRRLSESATLTSLGTTNPPESPVAWSSFATGMNPGRHGIFDFLRRDPETYIPEIALVEVDPPEFLLGFIPWRGPRIHNNRKGTTYWRHLDLHGIRTVNLRVPVEFPPGELDQGRTWSGLGVPDIRGTWGTYFYLATDLTRWDLGNTEFGGRLIPLEFQDNQSLRAVIDGPVDPRTDEYRRLEIPFEILLDRDQKTIRIQIQDQSLTLSEGEWSDWVKFQFSAGPFVDIEGISRFYLLQAFPEVHLYLMPISIDPSTPRLPLSHPTGYIESLADQFGPFKTLGWIHETWGLNEEEIDESVFLEDLFRNMENLEEILLSELEKGDASVYTAVFTATDSVSHMFYRFIDHQHPRYDEELSKQFGDAILRVYKRMDTIIGEILERLSGRDLLIVVSDHGFHSWRREFNTNTWLVENGYMKLKGSGSDQQDRKLDDMFSGGSFFPNVDWSQTRAYALGLGHIYVNLKGREGQGIVEPGAEYQTLIEEIRDRILSYRDPDNGEQVLHSVYFRDDIYEGNALEHAGDIQLSFRSGYRTSWQTSLGAVPENIVVANMKKWSGDHCASDYTNTSGILVSSRPIVTSDPTILDVAPTLLQLFDIKIPENMDGKPLIFE